MTGLGYGYNLSYPIHAYAENILLTLQGQFHQVQNIMCSNNYVTEFSLIYLTILYGKVTDIVTLTTCALYPHNQHILCNVNTLTSRQSNMFLSCNNIEFSSCNCISNTNGELLKYVLTTV